MRKDALENKQRIEQMAITLFNQEGVDNISMNRISKELGIGMGTLYRHFKDKSALCYSVIQYDFETFMSQMHEIKHQETQPERILSASLSLLLQFKVDHTALLHCIEEGNHKFQFFHSTVYQQLFEYYATLFTDDDANLAKFKTDMLIHALSTQAFEFQMNDRQLSIEHFKQYLMKLFLN